MRALLLITFIALGSIAARAQVSQDFTLDCETFHDPCKGAAVVHVDVTYDMDSTNQFSITLKNNTGQSIQPRFKVTGDREASPGEQFLHGLEIIHAKNGTRAGKTLQCEMTEPLQPGGTATAKCGKGPHDQELHGPRLTAANVLWSGSLDVIKADTSSPQPTPQAVLAASPQDVTVNLTLHGTPYRGSDIDFIAEDQKGSPRKVMLGPDKKSVSGPVARLSLTNDDFASDPLPITGTGPFKIELKPKAQRIQLQFVEKGSRNPIRITVGGSVQAVGNESVSRIELAEQSAWATVSVAPGDTLIVSPDAGGKYSKDPIQVQYVARMQPIQVPLTPVAPTLLTMRVQGKAIRVARILSVDFKDGGSLPDQGDLIGSGPQTAPFTIHFSSQNGDKIVRIRADSYFGNESTRERFFCLRLDPSVTATLLLDDYQDDENCDHKKPQMRFRLMVHGTEYVDRAISFDSDGPGGRQSQILGKGNLSIEEWNLPQTLSFPGDADFQSGSWTLKETTGPQEIDLTPRPRKVTFKVVDEKDMAIAEQVDLKITVPGSTASYSATDSLPIAPGELLTVLGSSAHYTLAQKSFLFAGLGTPITLPMTLKGIPPPPPAVGPRPGFTLIVNPQELNSASGAIGNAIGYLKSRAWLLYEKMNCSPPDAKGLPRPDWDQSGSRDYLLLNGPASAFIVLHSTEKSGEALCSGAEKHAPVQVADAVNNQIEFKGSVRGVAPLDAVNKYVEDSGRSGVVPGSATRLLIYIQKKSLDPALSGDEDMPALDKRLTEKNIKAVIVRVGAGKGDPRETSGPEKGKPYQSLRLIDFSLETEVNDQNLTTIFDRIQSTLQSLEKEGR